MCVTAIIRDPCTGGQTEEVFQKYYPIEIDPVMSVDQKIPHMREWYETNHSMMLREGITRDSITQATALGM